MHHRLRRELRFLRAYVIVSSALLCGLGFTAFQAAGKKAKFEEIDVERINIVERDGRLRLAISNKERSSGPIERGKPFGYPGGTRAGMIFYNDEGTEDGGLIFSGKKENGKVTAVGSLTFDQYEMDQTIALQYVDDGGQRRSGLSITDYPTNISTMEWDARKQAIDRMPEGQAKQEALTKFRKIAPAPRAYVGRTRDGASTVTLSDAQGKARLRLVVDALGPSRLEFLDENGHVTCSLPDTKQKNR